MIDDVKSQREISSQMLQKMGYQPSAVESGEAAIAYLQENSVDLLLLDMVMEPGMNGCETYEEIIKIHPGQKAVILSGFAETEDVKKAQRLGAGPYIKKPISFEQLGISVKNLLT